jgi:hypothetical protein
MIFFQNFTQYNNKKRTSCDEKPQLILFFVLEGTTFVTTSSYFLKLNVFVTASSYFLKLNVFVTASSYFLKLNVFVTASSLNGVSKTAPSEISCESVKIKKQFL